MIERLRSGALAGFEALVRMRRPDGSLVPPGEFIPLTEETGLIVHIGRWVLIEACRQMRAWQLSYPEHPPLQVSVNLAGRQFVQPDLTAQIEAALQESGLGSRSLKLEVTETLIMEHAEAAATVLEQLRSNPDSRRILVSAWNVAELDRMALMPCHALFQFYVAPAQPGERARLSCQLYQRSADLFLGVPFNIASYALLTHMVAQQCDLDVGDFVWTGGDCHIYDNHNEQVRTQLARTPYPYPQLHLRRRPATLFDYAFEDFEIQDYQHHPAIKAPVAV